MRAPVLAVDGPLLQATTVKFDSDFLRSEHRPLDLPPAIASRTLDVRINGSGCVTSRAVLHLLRGELCPRQSTLVQSLLHEAGVVTDPVPHTQQPDTPNSSDNEVLQGCSALLALHQGPVKVKIDCASSIVQCTKPSSPVALFSGCPGADCCRLQAACDDSKECVDHRVHSPEGEVRSTTPTAAIRLLGNAGHVTKDERSTAPGAAQRCSLHCSSYRTGAETQCKCTADCMLADTNHRTFVVSESREGRLQVSVGNHSPRVQAVFDRVQ